MPDPERSAAKPTATSAERWRGAVCGMARAIILYRTYVRVKSSCSRGQHLPVDVEDSPRLLVHRKPRECQMYGTLIGGGCERVADRARGRPRVGRDEPPRARQDLARRI